MKQQQYVLTEQCRRLILNMYDGKTETIDELARLLHVPRWRIKRWAADLGLARQKEPFWTEEEEAFLERNLHRKSVGEIAKHLGRTKTAVKLKAKKLKVNKTFQEGYTMQGLCLALGCDHHKVEKWLERGWLHGRRRKSERVHNDFWLFVDRDIRKFIISHPNEVDQRRCDFLWLVDLLAGGNDYGIGTLATDYAKSEEKEETA